LKEVRKYLGLKVERQDRQVLLNQGEYIEDILADFGKDRKINPRKVPLPKDLNSMKENVGEDRVPPIQDMLGKIRYLADRTRPDIAFSASFLARYAANPTAEHLNAMYQVFGYLKETKEKNLHIGSPSGEIKLYAMSDASFVRGFDSRGQLSYCLYLARDSGSFYSKSQKDKCVSTSSQHAEMHALVETTKMIIYYREILKEMHFEQIEPTLVLVDNEGVIKSVNSIGKPSQSIHLINKTNFIRECMSQKIIKLDYIRTEDNVADIGTKSLEVAQHSRLTAKVLRGANFEL
jgi:hypothetical protein